MSRLPILARKVEDLARSYLMGQLEVDKQSHMQEGKE